MKNGRLMRIFPMAILCVCFMVLSSCKKKDSSLPEATTGSVTDNDGNVYKTVKIGSQWWMAENLRTTTYNNGTFIPLVTDSATWRYSGTPGYCWFNNNISYKDEFGALYNWNAVNTGKLAPTGWHVPSDAEWTVLTTFLGGESVAGGKMKSPGTIEAATGLWFAPNGGATNESGFSALPGSCREYGFFFDTFVGQAGYWWSSTFTGIGNAWARDLNNVDGTIDRSNFGANFGFSIRCVKD
jgi:uncharacterized protein (TIGR02145 family)